MYIYKKKWGREIQEHKEIKSKTKAGREERSREAFSQTKKFIGLQYDEILSYSEYQYQSLS